MVCDVVCDGWSSTTTTCQLVVLLAGGQAVVCRECTGLGFEPLITFTASRSGNFRGGGQDRADLTGILHNPYAYISTD